LGIDSPRSASSGSTPSDGRGLLMYRSPLFALEQLSSDGAIVRGAGAVWRVTCDRLLEAWRFGEPAVFPDCAGKDQIGEPLPESADDRLTAVVVFPLPPFWLLMAIVLKVYLKQICDEADVTCLGNECPSRCPPQMRQTFG